ncbi:MAG: Na/Pi cotransporter family protein [Paludibacteraceae bacterium]|nr:Na/Pi cotransporter family protein [Paludibacteraceae bacterium]
MNFGIIDVLQLLGALGLFLFGMSMMSEALQKVAGNKMRSILASMTKNRLLGVLTGVIVTSIIQSSSATTVMVVSFVNAGLLTLAESISVIMGANIGTTITAWLVSLIGFKFSIANIAIPLIGFSLLFIFSKNDRRKSIGEVMVGFSLLFIGLEYLKNSVPDIKSNPEMLQFLTDYTNMGYGSILLFLLIGSILTVIVQSSSATMAITLIMLSQGWISFEIGAAMVLGENIGTTITANIAGLTAKTNARRAALSHTMFNICGVIWVLIIFYPFINLIEWMVGGNTTENANSLYALSMFHTMFNISNTLIMIWLVKPLEKIVCNIIPEKREENEFALQFISTGMLPTGELSLIEAEKEIEHYTERTHRMFDEARTLTLATYNDKNAQKYAERVANYESASDQTENAIADYLYDIDATPISTDLKNRIRNYLYLTTEVESVADRCFNISRSVVRRNSEKINFTEAQNNKLNEMFNLVDKHISALELCVKSNFTDETARKEIFTIEEQVNELRYALKVYNIDQVNKEAHSYSSGIHFMDIIEECESLSDAITKIAREVKLHQSH